MDTIDYWKKEVQLKDVVIDTLNKELEKTKLIIQYLVIIDENEKQISNLRSQNSIYRKEIDNICPQ